MHRIKIYETFLNTFSCHHYSFIFLNFHLYCLEHQVFKYLTIKAQHYLNILPFPCKYEQSGYSQSLGKLHCSRRHPLPSSEIKKII